MLRDLTVEDFREWNSCFEPTQKIPEEWQGTALELLDETALSFTDRIWGAIRESEWLDCRSVRELINYICSFHEFADQRSVDAVAALLTYQSEEDLEEPRRLAWLAFDEAQTDEDRALAKIAGRALNRSCSIAVNGVAEFVEESDKAAVIQKAKDLITEYNNL